MQEKTPKLLALLVTTMVVLAACGQDAETPEPLPLDEFARLYAAAWSGGDPEHFASFYAENGVLRINDGEPSVGRDAVEATARDFMTAFPDMRVEMVQLRQEGERITFKWHWTGTNTGPGGTGASVDLYGYEVWTLDDDGLIAESLGHLDEDEYARQLEAGGTD